MGISADEQSAGGRYRRAVAQTGAVGNTLMQHFQAGITQDPRAAFERSVGGALDRFKETAGRGIRSLRGSQVASGRSDTGFGYEDEDELLRTIAGDFGREVNERALQAEQLNLSRLGQVGQMADASGARYLDATGGDYNTLRAQRLQNEAERRSRRGSLLGSVIGAVGTIAGGPIGGIAARAIASQFSR